VSDQALRRHLAAGVDREQELIVRSGAGGRCGGCRSQLRRLLAEHAATTGGGAPAGPVFDGSDGCDLAGLTPGR
jgi:bacterioferritin-associated ferredoxin